jgi:hypothetical protein
MATTAVSAHAADRPPRRRAVWSIGMYAGRSPLALRPLPGNPVLTAADVTDAPAEFVADPFLVRRGSAWHLFFEVLDRGTGRGAIGWATGRPGQGGHGPRWRYQRIVLRESFHLSYPCVFASGDEVYMTPETCEAGAVRLYRAVDFPSRWQAVAELVGGRLADPTPFCAAGRWWMFACPAPETHDALRLYTAEAVTGPWREHPASPIVSGDPGRARPAGRPVRDGRGGWLRFAQDCATSYGRRVRALRITELGPDRYAERLCPGGPALAPGTAGWNAHRAHHLDAHRLADGSWIACADGAREPDPAGGGPLAGGLDEERSGA